MNPNETNSENEPVALTGDLKNKVVEGLEKKGAVFFSLKQLQLLLKILGPDTKMADIIKAMREQDKPGK